jgi:uncharacterized protein YcfL
MTSILYKSYWYDKNPIQLNFNNEKEAQYVVACWALFIEGEI